MTPQTRPTSQYPLSQFPMEGRDSGYTIRNIPILKRERKPGRATLRAGCSSWKSYRKSDEGLPGTSCVGCRLDEHIQDVPHYEETGVQVEQVETGLVCV